MRFDPQSAVIPRAKLEDYVLSPTHPVGRFKAAFFRALGYGSDRWIQLEQDLRTQHLGLDAEVVETTEYGTKYRIVAPLSGPAGRSALVVSIWIVRGGEQVPRIVTLYPGST